MYMDHHREKYILDTNQYSSLPKFIIAPFTITIPVKKVVDVAETIKKVYPFWLIRDDTN